MSDYVQSDSHLQSGYQMDNSKCDTVCKQAGGGGWTGAQMSGGSRPCLPQHTSANMTATSR